MTALHQMTTQQKLIEKSNRQVTKKFFFNKVNLNCRHTVILQVELLHDAKKK
jgi:hypothetical protein